MTGLSENQLFDYFAWRGCGNLFMVGSTQEKQKGYW